MKEITLNIGGKEIKATVSEKELEKLTKKEWPQVGDQCWSIAHDEIHSAYAENYAYQKNIFVLSLQKVGNMYRSKEQAQEAIRAQVLITAIAKRRKELNGDWIPNDELEPKRIITFSENELSASLIFENITASPFGVYRTIVDTNTIITEFRDELVWYFQDYTMSIN